jgi:transposase-like protein
MPHFRQSKSARGLSKMSFFEMTEDEAYEQFKKYRWPQTDGDPACPTCGIAATYKLSTRRLYKCKKCHRQFSATSGTLFAHRKLSYKMLLLAICEFSMDSRGDTALRMMQSLNVTYGTAYIMLHKLREAMGFEQKGVVLRGKVEVDGMAFARYLRPSGPKRNRVKKENTQWLIVMRERKTNRVLTFVVNSEKEGRPLIKKHVHKTATVITDDASHWNAELDAYFERVWRVNHSVCYAEPGRPWINTNTVESFNNEMRTKGRRHTRISGPHLGRYATEMAWRISKRKASATDRFESLAQLAATSPVSQEWKGVRNKVKSEAKQVVPAAKPGGPAKHKRRRYTY